MVIRTWWVLLFCSVASAASVESFTEPFRKIDLAPPEPGLIAEINVHEGDQVQTGQPVATLDNDLVRVAVEITKATMDARGRLESATAERDLRATRLGKLKELHQRGHASQEEIDRAQTDLTMAEAALTAEQERLTIDTLEHKKTQAMLDRRVLRSPIDGVVTRIYKEEREYVPINSPTVLTVVQLHPLRITFSVPTAQAVSLAVDQKVPLTFSETGDTTSGRIEAISPITDAESGTVRVKVLLDNPKGAYRSGVRCALDLPGDIGPAIQSDKAAQPLASAKK